MKNLFRILVIVFCGLVGTTFADDFKSKVVGPTTPLSLHVSGDDFMFIRNFTQEADASTTRGDVTVTKGGETAKVLTAAILSSDATPGTEEVINDVIIAGPADVTVTCGAITGNCFISYKKADN